ncbi:MAG: methyltransferase domain-containing protein [Desulfovibrionaceae bacterium]|nr:methyltransferase domain-containing protein [Desulfovibrionaceae bacterium]
MHNDDAGARNILSLMGRPLGRCLIAAEKALVRMALCGWPERGASVMEVNCGPGQLQPVLSDMGFDAYGCEAMPLLRQAFASNLSARYSAEPAHADLLPYDDGCFDWTLVHLEWTGCEESLAKVLAEARRISRSGMAVLYWNRYSLGAMEKRFPLSPLSGWAVKRVLQEFCPAGIDRFSALALPWRYWRKGRAKADSLSARAAAWLCRALNEPHCWGLGSIGLVRAEFSPPKSMTARPLRIEMLCPQRKELALAEQSRQSQPLFPYKDAPCGKPACGTTKAGSRPEKSEISL